jgi:hypothetical protein
MFYYFFDFHLNFVVQASQLKDGLILQIYHRQFNQNLLYCRSDQRYHVIWIDEFDGYKYTRVMMARHGQSPNIVLPFTADDSPQYY